MDLYNIFTKIPYIIMLGVGLTLVLQIYVGSLQNISQDIDENADAVYDTVIASEQVQNLGDRRSFIDQNYIGELGENDCSIQEVDNLDGEYLAFIVRDSPLQLDCESGTPGTTQNMVQSRLLLNGNEDAPATIMVYEIGS